MIDFKQEIFDIAATHLLTQMKKSEYEPNTGCLYDNGEGLHCAAWPFIHEYDENFEGQTALMLREEFENWGYIDIEIKFISGLQYIHDRYSPSQWKSELRKLARSHRLSTEVLKKF